MTTQRVHTDAWAMERDGERFIGIRVRSGDYSLALCEAESLAHALHNALTRANNPEPLPPPEPLDIHVSEDVSAEEVADALAALGLE